jgi:UDP-3-O-[3-hydroxymyristoyl] glucosamine N-acyltransferase
VAGFSSVTSHIPAGEKWGGIPVMPQGQNARLHVLLRRLPEVIKKLTKEKAEKEKEA